MPPSALPCRRRFVQLPRCFTRASILHVRRPPAGRSSTLTAGHSFTLARAAFAAAMPGRGLSGTGGRAGRGARLRSHRPRHRRVVPCRVRADGVVWCRGGAGTAGVQPHGAGRRRRNNCGNEAVCARPPAVWRGGGRRQSGSAVLFRACSLVARSMACETHMDCRTRCCFLTPPFVSSRARVWGSSHACMRVHYSLSSSFLCS